MMAFGWTTRGADGPEKCGLSGAFECNGSRPVGEVGIEPVTAIRLQAPRVGRGPPWTPSRDHLCSGSRGIHAESCHDFGAFAADAGTAATAVYPRRRGVHQGVVADPWRSRAKHGSHEPWPDLLH